MCRNLFLAGAHERDGHNPLVQGYSASLEYCSDCHGELIPAFLTLPDTGTDGFQRSGLGRELVSFRSLRNATFTR